MDITESLVTALTLLALGMIFVYLFLGLLFISINLMAKYIPAEEVPVLTRKKPVTPPVTTQAPINPKIIAAITSAIQQYRKKQAA